MDTTHCTCLIPNLVEDQHDNPDGIGGIQDFGGDYYYSCMDCGLDYSHSEAHPFVRMHQCITLVKESVQSRLDTQYMKSLKASGSQDPDIYAYVIAVMDEMMDIVNAQLDKMSDETKRAVMMTECVCCGELSDRDECPYCKTNLGGGVE